MKSVADMLPISQALGFRDANPAKRAGRRQELFLRQRKRSCPDRAATQSCFSTSSAELPVQRPRVELGQSYTSEGSNDEGTPFPHFPGDPELLYHHNTHPAPAAAPGVLPRTKTVSTLDLGGHGRFILLVGIGGEMWM